MVVADVTPPLHPVRRARATDVLDARSLSYAFRKRRDELLRAHILQAAAKSPGPLRILDLGGTVGYWRRVGLDFLRANNITVEILNQFEADLGAEDIETDLFKAVVGDACELPQHPDRSFHLVHSNSVVEHVGGWPRMKAFASEVRRLAPSYYVQTPNFWFPIDPHHSRFPCHHWLPAPWKAWSLVALPISRSGRYPDLDSAYDHLEHLQMLDERRLALLFPDAAIKYERIAGCFIKSFIAIR